MERQRNHSRRNLLEPRRVCARRQLGGHDPSGHDLIATGLLLLRRWSRDTPLSTTNLARWRINPSTGSSWLNHRRESSAVASITFHFRGSCFLNHKVG